MSDRHQIAALGPTTSDAMLWNPGAGPDWEHPVGRPPPFQRRGHPVCWAVERCQRYAAEWKDAEVAFNETGRHQWARWAAGEVALWSGLAAELVTNDRKVTP